jgi:hypothetical protein
MLLALRVSRKVGSPAAYADSAAPHAARDRNGCGSDEIVVILIQGCLFRSFGEDVLYGVGRLSVLAPIGCISARLLSA